VVSTSALTESKLG